MIPLGFTGRAGEYFRIWIVNICLSVISLGIYSAWAKVRRKQYFYGNTLLNGAAFDYLAHPHAILKGRLAVLGAWMLLAILDKFGIGGILFIAYIVLLPELVIRAARFNAFYSAHRGVRFHFGGDFPVKAGRLAKVFSPGYRQTSQFLILPIFLVPLSLGLMYPYYAFRKRQYFLGHSAWGGTPFGFDARPGAFYAAYGKATLMFFVFVVGSVVTLGIGALPLYILFASYRDAKIGRLSWKHTSLGPLRFECRWKTWDLFKLNLGNSLGVIFTLGLASPWAAIRSARYELEGLAVGPVAELDGFVTAAQAQTGAMGDEAAELLGFDLGL